MKEKYNNVRMYQHFDDDGLSAGAQIYRYENRNIKPECIYTIGYSNPLPDIEQIGPNERVYFLDYSFSNKETIDQLKYLVDEVGCEVIWIDHHKTSIEFAEKNPEFMEKITYLLSRERCGAYLTYMYIQTKSKQTLSNLERAQYDNIFHIPEYLKYIDDYDRFELLLEGTRPFHYGFAKHSEKKDVAHEIWDKLNDINTLNDIMSEGLPISTYVDAQNAIAFNNIFITVFEGHTIPVVNRFSNSEIFGAAYKLFDICMTYAFNGEVWIYTLYSRHKEGFPNLSGEYTDCEMITKKYGGGGHPGAAGFKSVEMLPLTPMCKIKDYGPYKTYMESLIFGR